MLIKLYNYFDNIEESFIQYVDFSVLIINFFR